MRPAAALFLALSTFASSAPALAADPNAGASATVIRLAFKLDPRLSGASYGGERWVSPPTYQGASGQSRVEAKAAAMDARGKPTKGAVDWKASDPEMVSVSPARGEQVTITVKRTGESSLTLTSAGVSRKLAISAVDSNGARQVTITQ